MADFRICCDICGRLRRRVTVCSYCHQGVCDRCDHAQAGVGHLEAEHRHEIAFNEGRYSNGWDDHDGNDE